MGRTIAQTMGYQGAGWLTREERDAEENTTLLHEQLALKPGRTACDLGAGNGYHTLKMARAVGPDGRAVAFDIQPQMLAMLERRARDAEVSNVETVLAQPGDPRLGTDRCDLILLVDVYHEFSDPAAMLEAMKAALTATGRIALVEYRAEDPEVPIKPLHKMTREQAVEEFGSAGFVLAEHFDGLPWQHLLFFRAGPS
jgi:ubiquinone/menaquinone biosynthesis C-methylase UbiE